MRLEGLGKFKNINDILRTRTPDFPACIIALQPSTLSVLYLFIFISVSKFNFSKPRVLLIMLPPVIKS
jgi:hypothetical protein